jgi:hypothetical protein
VRLTIARSQVAPLSPSRRVLVRQAGFWWLVLVVPILGMVRIVALVYGLTWFGWLSGAGLIPLAGLMLAWQNRAMLPSRAAVVVASLVCSASLWFGDLGLQRFAADRTHHAVWLIASGVAFLVIPALSVLAVWGWNRRRP